MDPCTTTPVLAAQIERMLQHAAYAVVQLGPAYVPLMERLQRELDAARKDDPMERAKAILAALP